MVERKVQDTNSDRKKLGQSHLQKEEECLHTYVSSMAKDFFVNSQI